MRFRDALGYYQNFDYDAFGNPVLVMDSAGNTLRSAEFNIRGMLTRSVDTDRGEWIYTRNALGESATITDANLKTSIFTYDWQSRLFRREVPEGAGSILSEWEWGRNSAARDVGKIASARISGTGITTYTETFAYDEHGRRSQTQIAEGANTYSIDTSYKPDTGFVDALTYPISTAGYRLKLKYDYQYGRLLSVKDFNGTTIFWQANEENARGQITRETLGNGLKTARSFDLVTGGVDFIHTGPGPAGGTSVQNLSYLFDRVGNLIQRQHNNIPMLTEDAHYDDLHRLDYTTLNGAPSLDLSYDSYGNITEKVQQSSESNYAHSYDYTYHPTKIHVLTSVTGTGSAIPSYEVAWFGSNLPKRIRKTVGQSANSSEFQYGPSGARWHHAYRQGSTLYTHVYIGALLEKVTEGANVEWKHYIFADGDPVALYERHSSGTETTWYMLKDHLGSVDALSDTNGGVFVRPSYDAFGRRRDSDWDGLPPPGDLAKMNTSTRRGLTFHEHLDSTGLIHMNGRVYDPLIGRFLSADPYVPDPFNTQDFNRYAYVRNNPLSYVDPSGFVPDNLQPDCDVNHEGDEGNVDGLPCTPRSGPVPVPCDFSPFCNQPSPWYTPPSYAFTFSLFGLERLQMRWAHMPRVPSADAPVGNGTLSQQESVFQGTVQAVADLRQRMRDSQVYGFLSNASEEIALSYGEDSIQAKVWEFFGENAVQTVTQTVEGNYTAAAGNLIQAVVKPAKVLSKLGAAGKSDAAASAATSAQRHSKEKEALVDMAKADKRKGITREDMEAYKDLNRGLPDPFPSKQVHGPEAHPSGVPSSRAVHGHVGPVDHIPIIDPTP